MSQQVKKKGGKEGKENYKSEDILQAIIIADSFNERFKPITIQTPRALLRVGNCATIEYTLEFLAGAGVQDILIFCRAHAEKIKNFINFHKKWGTKGRRQRSLSVQVIVSEDCYSMGDALREIDAKNLIRGDFVLVQGDLIANVDLQPALDAHRQRRTTDKNSIMTVVCRQVASRHPARSLEDQVVLTVEPATQRILHYQKTASGKKVRFPTEVLENRDDVEIRCDLLDCHISICTPLVPQLFSDNFDYLTRDDFIRGILINEEIMGNTIHSFLLNVGYTARISNLHMYDVVSRDIIGRWVYPFCPDLGFPDGDAFFYKRHHIYQQRDVQLSMGAVLEENVIVGGGSTVGENSIIRNSVIGNFCKIGANCRIDGAYIWDGCVVQSDCQLRKCLLADRCFVAAGSVILAGAILSHDVRLGPNARIPVGMRLIGQADHKTLAENTDDFEKEGNQELIVKPVDVGVLGDDPSCVAWTVELSTMEDSDQESDGPGVNFEENSWKWWTTPEILEEEDNCGEISSSSDEEAPSDDEVAKVNVEDSRIFFNEISESLMRAVEENVGMENVVLEINASKFAYNINMSELNKLVIRSILEIPELRARHKKRDFVSAKELFSELQVALKSLLPVLRNYFRSEESKFDAVFAIEESVLNYVDLPRHQPYGTFLNDSVLKIFNFFYEEEILPENVILDWFNLPAKSHLKQFSPFFLHEPLLSPRRRNPSGGDLNEEDIAVLIRKIDALKKKLEPFIKWLQEAEEESE